ncbi:oligopeptide transporter 1 [Diutina catenulata]
MDRLKAIFRSDDEGTAWHPEPDEKKLAEGEEVPLDVVVSKNSEFDPVTSRMIEQVMSDDYAHPTVADDSPYPEVRAAVPSTDDPTLPQNTLRMWTLGLVFTMIGSAVNLLFSFHAPAVNISTLAISVVAWPFGWLWYIFIPKSWHIGRMYFNPGPFNIKEHTLITIMANVSFGQGTAYATDILLAQNRFYNSYFGWGFDLCAIWSTQCIGFAMGGLAKRFVVYPASAIWPSNLVTATFLTNLHINKNHVANGWKISRLSFFGLVFVIAFCWYWIPGLIFTGLSNFAWICWIKPKNVIVNQIFGSYTGLGMFPNSLALDWSQIMGYIGSPLIPPASTLATILLSMVIIFWAIVPAVHYSNTWYAQYLPMSSSDSYDRWGKSYNVTKVVTDNLRFDVEGYKAYSPLFLSTTFAMSYGLSFASILATIVHTVCFHGRELVEQFKRKEKPDVHMRLMMQNYKEVPEWWFVIVFLVFFGMSVATVRAWDTGMPVYALIVALLIAAVFLLPVAIVFARTNIAVGLNVVTEFIIGYMVPGRPLGMMFFKTYGYITNNQAVTFVQDMKLGHYMKIAPRLLFWVQLIASIWSSLVQICVLKWAYGAIDNLCAEDQKDRYTCPNGRVFFNASIIWGVLGPQRQFSHGQIYYGLLFFFIAGALLPFTQWLFLKKWPNSAYRHLNWPVFFSGTGMIPPATAYNYLSYCTTGLIFNWWIKKKWFHWWSKYNYTLSAALDTGTIWSMLIIFFTISLTNTDFPSWWGNDYTSSTLDQMNEAVRTPAPPEGFGPTTW